jgi:hypothetical protein
VDDLLEEGDLLSRLQFAGRGSADPPGRGASVRSSVKASSSSCRWEKSRSKTASAITGALST